MKNIKILAVILSTVLISGCAFFSNEAQYDRGDWHFIAGSREVARIKQDKLAFNKVRATPAKIAFIDSTGNTIETIPETAGEGSYVFKGFKGRVANFSNSKKINFVIRGPETRAHYNSPGQHFDDYLIQGYYTVSIFEGGRKIDGPNTFHVGPRTHNFMGEEVHWYVYYDP